MEKYFEMLEKINKENVDMTKLYLLSCLDLSDKELATEQMKFCYDLWLEADVDMDLARLTDIVKKYWEEIQNDKLTDEEIIEECLNV